jgi:glycosyltransferase involved in cell wall biosynthesis
MPLFSVVIPLYNKEAHVSRAISSVLGQALGDFELVVVDDGSTDNGGMIVRNFGDSRIRLVSQRNAGRSAARNTGIRSASSNLIAFLDADDEWDPDFLTEIARLIGQFPSAGAYATHIRGVAAGSVPLEDVYDTNISAQSWMIGSLFSCFALGYYPVSSSSVCVKKEVLEKTGFFNEKLAIGEDLDMWIRIHREAGIAMSNRFAATYHTDAQNRSVHQPDFSLKELQFFRHLRQEYMTPALDRDSYTALRQWSSRRIYIIIVRLINQRERRLALSTLLENRHELTREQRALIILRLLTPERLGAFIRQHKPIAA